MGLGKEGMYRNKGGDYPHPTSCEGIVDVIVSMGIRLGTLT